MSFERHAVHVIEFPFSDGTRSKRRPALVLGDADFADATGNVTLAMITSAKHPEWPGDCAIGNVAAAGLRTPCRVRLRFVTLAVAFVGERIGQLAADDSTRVTDAIRSVLLSTGSHR